MNSKLYILIYITVQVEKLDILNFNRALYTIHVIFEQDKL